MKKLATVVLGLGCLMGSVSTWANITFDNQSNFQVVNVRINQTNVPLIKNNAVSEGYTACHFNRVPPPKMTCRLIFTTQDDTNKVIAVGSANFVLANGEAKLVSLIQAKGFELYQMQPGDLQAGSVFKTINVISNYT